MVKTTTAPNAGEITEFIKMHLARMMGPAAGQLADYFDVHLDHAPNEGATLTLDSIVLVARSIGGGRVNVVGLRLPEDEEEAVPLTRMASLKQKLSSMWSSVAGI